MIRYLIRWQGIGFWIGAFFLTGVIQHIGAPPAIAQAAPLNLIATPLNSQVRLDWDAVAGATSYTVYRAEQPGITENNIPSRTGWIKIPGLISNNLKATGLSNNKIYYFAVSATNGTADGALSQEIAAAPIGEWASVGGLTSVTFYSVAADQRTGTIAYAAGGSHVYKTTDGLHWSALGEVDGKDVRTLAVSGDNIYAATRETPNPTPSQIWKSPDGGGSWTAVLLDGGSLGETYKSLVIDPKDPNNIYAGDLVDPGVSSNSLVIKSTNFGQDWTAAVANCSGCDVHADTLIVDSAGAVYAGGEGTPNLARSPDGSTWTDVHLNDGFVYAVAADPSTPSTALYAGNEDLSHVSRGIYKSVDGGMSWNQKNIGLPSSPPHVYSLFVDPLNPTSVYAGTDIGVFYSPDGGDHWATRNSGFPPGAPPVVTALAITPSRKLIAGTSAGLFLLDLAPNLPGNSADLSISGTVSADPVVGQNLTYTVWVTNLGPDAASNVVVTETPPAGLAIVSVTSTLGLCDGTSLITCSLGTLGLDGSAKIALTVTPTSSGTATSEAEVGSDVNAPSPANDAVQITATVNDVPSGGGGGESGGGSGGGSSGGSGGVAGGTPPSSGGGGGCVMKIGGDFDPTLAALFGLILIGLGRKRMMKMGLLKRIGF